jgi:hypothetical protein
MSGKFLHKKNYSKRENEKQEDRRWIKNELRQKKSKTDYEKNLFLNYFLFPALFIFTAYFCYIFKTSGISLAIFMVSIFAFGILLASHHRERILDGEDLRVWDYDYAASIMRMFRLCALAYTAIATAFIVVFA